MTKTTKTTTINNNLINALRDQKSSKYPLKQVKINKTIDHNAEIVTLNNFIELEKELYKKATAVNKADFELTDRQAAVTAFYNTYKKILNNYISDTRLKATASDLNIITSSAGGYIKRKNDVTKIYQPYGIQKFRKDFERFIIDRLDEAQTINGIEYLERLKEARKARHKAQKATKNKKK